MLGIPKEAKKSKPAVDLADISVIYEIFLPFPKFTIYCLFPIRFEVSG